MNPLRDKEVYVRAVATELPETVEVRAAVDAGHYDAEDWAETELVSVCVEEHRCAPDLAVAAARTLADRCASARDATFLAYAHIYHQGQEIWNPAAYVSHQVFDGVPTGFTIGQASNGGMLGLSLGVDHALARGGEALVVTADRYQGPGFDRWRTDTGQVYADGATAALVSTVDGFARILSIESIVDHGLEALTRQPDFSASPLGHGSPIDLRTPKRKLLVQRDYAPVFQALTEGTTSVVRRALDAAGISMSDISKVVTPNIGLDSIQWEFCEPLEITEDDTLWDWGRTVGHLGAGDQFAGLERLISTEAVHEGEHVLLLGAGLGFCWTAAVLRIQAPPRW